MAPASLPNLLLLLRQVIDPREITCGSPPIVLQRSQMLQLVLSILVALLIIARMIMCARLRHPFPHLMNLALSLK